MKGKSIYISAFLFAFFIFNCCYAFTPVKHFGLVKDGIIIYPDNNLSGNTRAVRLLVISVSVLGK